MRSRNRENSNFIKKYNQKKKISSSIWAISGLFVLGFGIYYREVFEIVFGILAIIFAFLNLRSRLTSISSITRLEKGRLKLLAVFIVIFSLVNPIGNIAVIYDLFKRDFAINGGFDEKEI